MNRMETISLWEKCQNAKKPDDTSEVARTRARELWNQWANQLLAKRDELESKNLWSVHEEKCSLIGLNDASKAWLDEARVDFSSMSFTRASSDNNTQKELPIPDGVTKVGSHGSAIDFEGFIFPGECLFQQVTFDGWVWFKKAQFYGPVQFTTTNFLGWVGFQDTKFNRRAWINEVVFSDHAIFKGARFERYAKFDLSEFNQISDFCGAVFLSDASFLAVYAASAFLLDHNEFAQAPDFHQAHFNEAPVFGVKNVKGTDPQDDFRRSFDVSLRWGALKRIANQAQDHQRELELFAKELQTNIGMNRMAVVLVTLYGMISNYGRSSLRPLVGLIVNAVFFFIVYYRLSILSAGSGGKCAFPGDDVAAAKFLSIINSIPLFGIPLVKEFGQEALICIGVSVPGLSAWVVLALSAEIFFATTFLFLIILALRNHFAFDKEPFLNKEIKPL